jgi:hypothetical protein
MTNLNKDYELDRLKDEQERTFRNKQQAWDKQNNAWETLNSLRARSGPRIDYLNAEQKRLYESMVEYFERSKYAFSSGDHDGAKSYSAQGKECKARLPEVVEERRRLVAELRATGDVQKEAVAEFRLAKEEFTKASLNFKARLEVVKSQNQRKRDDKKEVARRAGVPSQYLDNVWIGTRPDGTVNIYFGGVGQPDGIGHGHYVMNRDGEVTYKREPFRPVIIKNSPLSISRDIVLMAFVEPPLDLYSLHSFLIETALRGFIHIL